MSDTADHLEREIETRRANVEDTLDRLKGRLSVDQVVDDIGQFIGMDDVRGTLASAGRQVRDNPLALGLIGAGMVWLMMGRSGRDDGEGQDDRTRSHTPYSGAWPADKTQAWSGAGQQQAGGLRDTLGDHATEAKEKASTVVHGLADKVGQVASGVTGSVKHMAADVADRVHARDVIRPVTERMEQQPLLLGGMALIAGAVIGAALPRTRAEDRLMGEPRNRLIQEAREATRGVKERATQAAQRTYEAAVKAAEDEGLVPSGESTIAEKVEHVAAAAMDEVRNQVDPVLHGTAADDGASQGADPSARANRNRK